MALCRVALFCGGDQSRDVLEDEKINKYPDWKDNRLVRKITETKTPPIAVIAIEKALNK